MVRQRRYLSTLEIGEVSPDFLRNAAEDFLKRACKTALNVILKAGGGTMRRPGGENLFKYAEPFVRFRYRGRGVTEELAFENTRLVVRSSTGTTLQVITGCPWLSADLDSLEFSSNQNSVFVVSQDLPIQELKRASDGTWSRTDYSFADSVNGKTAQPFYDKFNDIDVTMTIGGYLGSGVTISFSDDVLEAGHVGLRFRYLAACEFEIASVTDGQNGTINIIDQLYPTLTCEVGSNAGYKVGQVVQGSVSDVLGLVTEVSGATTIRVVLLEGYEYFTYSATAADNDALVSPEAAQKLTGTPTLHLSPATTSIWDEQLISAVRGYPGTVEIHKNRLIFSAFPQATDVLVGSALGNFYNFTVGAEPEDAFNEELGADPNSLIRYVVSTEQLLVFSDRGIFFVPETPESPLTPDSIEFAPIGPDGCANVRPVFTPEGVLFIDEDAGRLMVAGQTGNRVRPWNIAELSEASFHLLTGPKKIVVANGLDGRTERYALVLNTDGTIACMMYRRGSDVVGFSKWTHGEGLFDDITASEDDVILTSKVTIYPSGGGEDEVFFVSRLTFGALVDDEVSYEGELDFNHSGIQAEVVDNLGVSFSGTINYQSGLAYEFTDFPPAVGLKVGFDFPVDVTPAPQISSTGLRRIRIPRLWVDVIDTGVIKIGKKVCLPFSAGDPLIDPGKVRTEVIQSFQLGWTYDRTQTISQERGQGTRMDIRSITMEVSR